MRGGATRGRRKRSPLCFPAATGSSRERRPSRRETFETRLAQPDRRATSAAERVERFPTDVTDVRNVILTHTHMHKPSTPEEGCVASGVRGRHLNHEGHVGSWTRSTPEPTGRPALLRVHVHAPLCAHKYPQTCVSGGVSLTCAREPHLQATGSSDRPGVRKPRPLTQLYISTISVVQASFKHVLRPLLTRAHLNYRWNPKERRTGRVGHKRRHIWRDRDKR